MRLEPLVPGPGPGPGRQNPKERSSSPHPDPDLHPDECVKETHSCLEERNRNSSGVDIGDNSSSAVSTTGNAQDCHTADVAARRSRSPDMAEADNLAVWVGKVADLSAGYLPGDLSSVVRRAAGR